MAPQTAPKAPKARWVQKCSGCHNLDLPQATDYQAYPDEDSDGGRRPRFLPRTAELSLLLKNMGRGCQTCFAILKAIDNIILAFIPELPPGPHPDTEPVPQKAAKFPFLAYIRRSDCGFRPVIQIRRRWQHQPNQVTAMLYLAGTIKDDAFPFGDVCLLRPSGGKVPFSRVCFSFELFCEPSAASIFNGILPARRVPARLTSDRRRRLVRGWLDDCLENHTACGQLITDGTDDLSASWRPKRLIDLTGNPRNAVKVVDSANTTGPYATMSLYEEPPESLTVLLLQRRLSKMAERIRWSELPLMIQDAVVLASEQGIRYLWIDAMCVIIDDPGDVNWHIEQAHKIFGNSYLNIAFIGPKSLDRTSLGARNLQAPLQTHLPLVNDVKQKIDLWDSEIELFKGGKSYKVYARPEFHDAPRSMSRFPYHNEPNRYRPFSPLSASTKFFQEQILSPRTLHIDSNEFAWECRTRTGCECQVFTNKLSTGVSIGSPRPIPLFKLALMRKLSSPLDPKPENLWHLLRSTYPSRHDWDPERRLHYLVGLAACFQRIIDKAFVGGVFANSNEELTKELLWYVDRNQHRTGKVWKSSGLWLPTWSWASIYFARSGHKMTDVMDEFKYHFVRDRHFRIRAIESKPEIGVSGPNSLHATDWRLLVSGRLIVGKIATREQAYRRYEFVAANANGFPPPLPPVPPEAASRPQRTNSDNLMASPARSDDSFGLRDLFAPSTPQPPRPIPRTETKSSAIFPAGHFVPDCDVFDDERQGWHRGLRRPSSSQEPQFTWAYFLLLGRVVDDNDMWYPDDKASWRVKKGASITSPQTGLALRRARDGRSNAFERIGLFWITSESRAVFQDAQTQTIMLV